MHSLWVLYLLKRSACQVDPNARDTRTVLSHLALDIVNVQLQVEDRIRHKLGSSGEQHHS